MATAATVLLNRAGPAHQPRNDHDGPQATGARCSPDRKDNAKIEAQRTLELYRLHQATKAQADAAQRVLDNLDKDYGVKKEQVHEGSAPQFAHGGLVGAFAGISAAARNDNAPITINLSMVASGNPRADRESADQAAGVLRRRLRPMRA